MCSPVRAPSPGPYFIFCSPCLHSFSIRHSHALFTWPHICLHTVCRPRLTQGTTPPHFYYLNNFHVSRSSLQCWRWKRPGKMLWVCGISMKLECVFHLWLGHGPGLFHLSCFFSSLYLYSVGDVWASLHFFSISRLLSLVLPLLAFFFLLPAAVFLHLILQALIAWQFLLSLLTWFAPQPFNLIVFFRNPLLPLWQCIISSYISMLQSSHDSLCVPPFLPRSCLHEL